MKAETELGMAKQVNSDFQPVNASLSTLHRPSVLYILLNWFYCMVMNAFQAMINIKTIPSLAVRGV